MYDNVVLACIYILVGPNGFFQISLGTIAGTCQSCRIGFRFAKMLVEYTVKNSSLYSQGAQSGYFYKIRNFIPSCRVVVIVIHISNAKVIGVKKFFPVLSICQI